MIIQLDYAETLEKMLAIARDASALVARVYATHFDIQYKGPADPVTNANRAANTLVCERLRAAFGDAAVIVAEESDPTTYATWTTRQYAFFVDPLDGTAEFVRRNGEFVVMIGLAADGVAVAGVMVAPVLGVSWMGGVGIGAWEIDSQGRKQAIHVSSEKRLECSSLVISRSHATTELERAVAVLAPARVVRKGSAGLKGAGVARGESDVFLQPGAAGKRWDACAPEAIIRAAGGLCTDALGNAIDYRGPRLDNDRGLLMSNEHLHEVVLQRLATLSDAP